MRTVGALTKEPRTKVRRRGSHVHRVRETERENERRLWLWTSDHQRGLARGPDHRCDLVGRTDPSVHQVRKTHLEKPCLRGWEW